MIWRVWLYSPRMNGGACSEDEYVLPVPRPKWVLAGDARHDERSIQVGLYLHYVYLHAAWASQVLLKNEAVTNWR